MTRPGRLLRLVAGLALLAWAAALDPAFRMQITAGGAALLLSSALGTVTSAELGSSGVLQAFAAPKHRLAELESFCEKRKTALVEDALALVDDDPDAARELVELAAGRAAGEWSAEVDARKLYGFLVCSLVDQAQQQRRQRIFSRSPDAPPRPAAWHSLSIYERAVIRLIDTHRVDPEVVAEMLDRSPAVVRADHDRCVQMLDKSPVGHHGPG
ncbi:hypothetical protein ABZS66_48620 [Dactylosporangium sp. NPDC005572]|uniref:hypothetical protein n=1 Tax=Dactylosporangium sp. NPDC005572 TaxID=3156889 RepID=UPI0033BB2D07